MSYTPTDKQVQAQALLSGPARHILMEGGSRSGKTFLALRTIAVRALSAPVSRHAALRYRFNHARQHLAMDTWPKMMQLCFPAAWSQEKMSKSDWYYKFPNGSEVWFGGLDDKERTEKILGAEYSTIFFNECSQIPYQSVLMALTRLAQRSAYDLDGRKGELRLKAIYDCNPPSTAHWTYKLFHRSINPDGGQITDPHNYAHILLNPEDNKANIAAEYLDALRAMPPRMRARFYEGKYSDTKDNALWDADTIETWRTTSDLPDMQRIVVAVDPSGSGDVDNANNDAIGIVVAGLGTDGNGYVLEDLTVKAGPKVWGNIAATAYDRHKADLVVGETNYGGEMVGFVIQTAKPGIPFKKITASRGKAVRAAPIAALTEQGRIRFAGRFAELEDELCSFTTAGYAGSSSPNRADAFVWAMSELFPGIVRDHETAKLEDKPYIPRSDYAWMG